MDEKDTFKMTYSASRQEEIEKIRKKYMPEETSKMEQLRILDGKANKKATAVSVGVGVTGTLIMGIGMSLIMSDFGKFLGEKSFASGIALGVIGMAVLACAYPLYNHTLKKERKKNAPEILRLSDELMNRQ